jgi:hypothetical protein
MRQARKSGSALQETAKSTTTKILIDKDQALVDSLSTRVCPYLRGFWPS